MKRSAVRIRLAEAAGLLAAALILGAPAQPVQAQSADPPAAGAQPAAQSAPAQPAEAEASAGGKSEEIIVTATRHEQALSKVPVSVSAFTQESMDEKGIKDFTDVVRYTPGVTIDATGTGNNNISIRGITSSGGSGTTGIYIDDTPIQIHSLGFNADDTLPKTFDLERVEVLRGPQGTLFGAGSEGGTVRYILTQPSLTKASMYARSEIAFTQGGDPSYEAGVAAGLPIIDGKLGVRASIWYRRDGGWIDRIDPFTLATVDPKSNWDATYVARLAAKWAVTPDITLTPSLLYQHRNRNDVSVFWPQDTSATGQVVRSDPSSHRFLNADPTGRPEPDHYFLPVLKAEADFGGASLISNTSYYTRDDLSGYDGTLYNLGYYQGVGTRNAPCPNPNFPSPCAATPLGTLQFASDSLYPLIDQFGLHLPSAVQNYRAPASVINEQRTFTEELRLQSNDPNARLAWTTGLFYQFTRQVSLEEIYDPMVDTLFNNIFIDSTTGLPAFATGPEGFGFPLVQNGYSYYNYNTGHDRQIALFGEASYEVIPRVKLTLGARIAKTAFDFSHYADGTQNGGPSFNSGSKQETPFTPKAGVSFQADRNNLYYFTYAKGFRTGGDNAPIAQDLCPDTFATLGLNTPSSPATYNSDSVKSFEIGSKNKIGPVRLATSAYYIRWNDIQQNIYLPGCGFQFTTNVGTAAAKGFDVQADWNATESLSIESAIGYTNARYLQDANLVPGSGPCPATSPQCDIAKAGDAVVGDAGTATPPWTITIGATYEFEAFSLPSYVHFDYQYQSKSHFLTAAQDPGVSPTVYDPYAYTPPATTFVTMRAGAKYKGWDLSAFVDNLFDTHPLLPPGGPNSHSDADPSAAASAGAISPQGVLMRNYTFRPRTIGLTAILRM